MGESVSKPGQSGSGSVQKPKQSGAKEKTPGSGRKKGSANKRTIEVRELAQRFLSSKAYQENLQHRLDNGCAPAAVETMLWYYGYGKPVERIEVGDKAGFFDKVVRQAKGDK